MKSSNYFMSFLISAFILSLLLIIPSRSVKAQDDEYKKWLEKENKAFQDYQTEQDRQFIELLKKGWIKTETKKSEPIVDKPKPVTPPVITQTETKKQETETKKIEVIPPKKEVTEGKQAPKELVKIQFQFEPVNKDRFTEQINFDFFGSPLSIQNNPNIPVTKIRTVDNSAIAKFWDEMSKSDYKAYITQAMQLKEKLKLNDWGYIQLVNEISRKMSFSSANEQMLFVWFIMSKSGYFCKAAYGNNKVFVVFATEEAVFGSSYLRDNSNAGRKLYILLGNPAEFATLSEVYCFNGNFPDAVKPVDLAVTALPDLKMVEGTRNVSVTIKGQKYQFTLPYNKSLVRYFEWYPQTTFPIYPRTRLSQVAETPLMSQLKKDMAGMTKAEALNFLLHFVQYATDYKTDQEQFQREKPFFPEESLYYSASDCEDRSILFSYLVQGILGEKVVLLDYPDHIATAVRMPDDMSGVYFELGRDKYFVCDPTYIGANAGVAMPTYKNVKPNIISLD